MKKVSRRWFIKAAGVGAVGLATFLPMLKGARVDKNAAPLPDNLPIHPGAEQPPPLPAFKGRMRRFVLHLGATEIPPHTSAMICRYPTMAFRLDRIVTPSKGLVIEGLSVGAVSQFVGAGVMVPTEVFSPLGPAVRLSGDTCVPGLGVMLTIHNPTDEAKVFSGAILGNVIESVA